MLTIGSLLLRVNDLDAQIKFWSEALDYRVTNHMDHNFMFLRPKTGEGIGLALSPARSELGEPPRLHMDLYTEDQASEVARLESLGAKQVHWKMRPTDADYIIMEDPEGNRFCVIDISE